jgi:hypothetical protein
VAAVPRRAARAAAPRTRTRATSRRATRAARSRCGIGFGGGTGLGALAPPPPPPPPPAALAAPRSLARPARLVYPSRERDVEESRLFVARLTIDTDGYVVGAHLVRGFGGPRDRDAADAIWRFRYDPARDDAGRPVRSVLDQKFLVQ